MRVCSATALSPWVDGSDTAGWLGRDASWLRFICQAAEDGSDLAARGSTTGCGPVPFGGAPQTMMVSWMGPVSGASACAAAEIWNGQMPSCEFAVRGVTVFFGRRFPSSEVPLVEPRS